LTWIRKGVYIFYPSETRTTIRREDLASPVSDAARVANVLEEKYGFTVKLVRNANDVTVPLAINNLNSIVGEEDNLLICYTGHGSRRGAGDFEMGD